MQYKIGQAVKVKQGVQCPDDPDFDLSEWQGSVIEIIEENSENAKQVQVYCTWFANR